MKVIMTLITTLIFLTSCGVDPINKGTSSASKNALAAQCSCTSEYYPVCANDGKTYDNVCIAKCMGTTQWTQGHCQCQPTLMVCGIDGNTYNECDAINFRIKIAKFTACNQTPL